MSNLSANEAFTGTQTYSPQVSPAATENGPNTVFIATFSVFDPTYQQGLDVTVSPDDGLGGRMAWVGLVDSPDGIEISTSDSSGANGDFVDTPLGLLSHGLPHTIEFRIKLNPGSSNDQVRILIDGVDTGQCFTTWEEYYRHVEMRPPPEINSLQFRASQATFHTPNAGYLFDNVTTTTGTGPTSPGCDVTIDKEADASTVTAGGLAGYRINVRNRGRLTERNLLACDHIPREATFVSASRKLRRLGRRRCLFISRLGPGQRVSFHITLRVNANATPGTLDNVADITPEPPPGSPVAPPVASADLPPGGVTAPITPIEKATAPVKVMARPSAPAPPPPAVTG
jgi:uncharacterized repeat protein (TIGR01451 family)